MPVGADQELAYRPLVSIGRCQPERGDDALGAHRERYLEAVDPLRLGHVPAEGRLPGEQPLAVCPGAHDGRDERCVEYPVDLRAVR